MSFNPSRIIDSHLLTDRFGAWPSFHDAEVLQVTLDRSGPDLIATLHVFEVSAAVTADGFYELQNHTSAVLRFGGIAQLHLEEFNHQNALMGLQLEDISSHQLELLRWNVSFDAAHGLDATFMCRSITVERATDHQSSATSASSTGTQGRPGPEPHRP